MAIANYTDLQGAVADWLERDDLTDRIPDFILMAEATLNRIIRDPRMITSAAISLATTYEGTLPSDFLEQEYYEITTGNVPIQFVSQDQYVMLRQYRIKTATATPKFYTIRGSKVLVAPKTSTTVGTTLYYYQAIPALASNATNWLLTAAPDLYLYVSLMHAEPFLGSDQRATWLMNPISQAVQGLLKRNEMVALTHFRRPGFTLDAPGDPKPPAQLPQVVAG